MLLIVPVLLQCWVILFELFDACEAGNKTRLIVIRRVAIRAHDRLRLRASVAGGLRAGVSFVRRVAVGLGRGVGAGFEGGFLWRKPGTRVKSGHTLAGVAG